MFLFFLTGAFAALHVRLKLPSLVAGALDAGFLLFTLLATLEVFGAEALDLAGLVVSSELHAQRTRAHEALPRYDAAVVTTAAIVQCTQVCGQQTQLKGRKCLKENRASLYSLWCFDLPYGIYRTKLISY